MAAEIPPGVTEELVRRTRPVGRPEPGDVGEAAAREALATSTAGLVDLLGQHLADGEEVRDVHAASGHKVGMRGCAVRVGLLTLTDRRILCAVEDQMEGVAPTVVPVDYGAIEVRGRRMAGGGPSLRVDADGVFVLTRNGKVDEVTARLSAPPARADWLAAAWSAGGGADAGLPAAAWHPDPTGRHEHRWWDGSAWTDQVADGGVTASDPLPEG